MKSFLVIFLFLLTLCSYGQDRSFENRNPPGLVIAFAGLVCPPGYLSGNGLAVNRTTYSKLFSVIGTIYGSGNGTTTFNLPDYRGQFMRGVQPNGNIVGSGSASSNNATFTSHGFNKSGSKVRMVAGALSGLTVTTGEYFVIYVDDNTLAFASSLTNALTNTKLAISGVNTATIRSFADGDILTRVLQNGVNSSSVGSLQIDEFKAHTHSESESQVAGSNYPQVGGGGGGEGVTGSTGGTETRPSNISVNYCIKY